jgi:arylsulfatase A-like enzyme
MRHQKPNILFIMADQMNPLMTGAYAHPVVKTPSLVRLAEEGVRWISGTRDGTSNLISTLR